jgi:hypothetical protein
MEGSEKFNDIMKHHYDRNSNKKNVVKSLHQIIQKQNRCELKRSSPSENQQSRSKYLKTPVRGEGSITASTTTDI